MHETEDPLVIMMIELYKTEEAHANHVQTDHFKTLGMALAPFLDGAPEITVHKSVN
jgi:quinol monooxygenase YgiN